MHTKTHENARILRIGKQSPILFFSEIERQIFEGVGFGFFLRRKFVIVEVVYMIHTEMSRLL